MNIGLKIKELRIIKNVTQDELAKAVGISSQAVSKWENGGLPDIELLPAIAEFFNVTIDYLYDISSHNLDNIDEILEQFIVNIPNQKDRFLALMELCWRMVNNIPGQCSESIRSLKEIYEKYDVSHMEVTQKDGIAMMRIAKEESFFFVAPKPQNNYNYLLKNKDLCIKAFEILSKADTYDALIFLNSRDNKNFTPILLVKELGIEYQRAVEIIKELKNLNLISITEIELDDEIKETYSLKKNSAIIGLIAFIDMIVIRPKSYHCFYGNDIALFK